MLRPASVLALLVAAMLAGCTSPMTLAAAQEDPPDRLLVRMFVDDPDAEGRSDLVIRLAAYAPPEDVQPFRGELLLLVRPGMNDPSWTPRAVTAVVRESDFIAGPLPYYQLQIPAGFLSQGELVLVEAEAVLEDGTVLRGSYQATV